MGHLLPWVEVHLSIESESKNLKVKMINYGDKVDNTKLTDLLHF